MATKVGQLKDKDFDAIEARTSFCDMPLADQAATIEICREAYSRLPL